MTPDEKALLLRLLEDALAESHARFISQFKANSKEAFKDTAYRDNLRKVIAKLKAECSIRNPESS